MEITPSSNLHQPFKMVYTIPVILLLVTLVISFIADNQPALVDEFSFNAIKAFYIAIFAIITFIFGFIALAADSENKKYLYGTLCGTTLVLSFCFASIFWIINTHYDDSKPIYLVGKIIKKIHWVSKGGGGQSLLLSFDNQKMGNKTFNVSSQFYNSVKIGVKVELSVKKGVLNRPWVSSYQTTESIP